MNRSEKKSKGICYDCHEPAIKDRVRCGFHLERNTLGALKYAKSEKGTKYISDNKENIKEYQANWRKNNRRGKGRFSYVKNHAKRRKLEFTLNESDYYSLINLDCYYCTLPNNVEAGIGLDRLDNNKGYIINNVVSCCIECNYVRGNRFTPEEMAVIGQAIYIIKLSRIDHLEEEAKKAFLEEWQKNTFKRSKKRGG